MSNSIPTNKPHLLPRVARGERDAMEACIATYSRLVWSIARKYARDEADAQDLTQEVFTELWRKASRYDEKMAAESTYVGMLARRRSIDWVRKQARRPATEPISPEVSDTLTEDSHPAVRLDHEVVMQALSQLSEETQQCFRLHFELGMSHSEIANQTGAALGTVKTRLRQGLITLRRFIHQADSSPTPTISNS